MTDAASQSVMYDVISYFKHISILDLFVQALNHRFDLFILRNHKLLFFMNIFLHIFKQHMFRLKVIIQALPSSYFQLLRLLLSLGGLLSVVILNSLCIACIL